MLKYVVMPYPSEVLLPKERNSCTHESEDTFSSIKYVNRFGRHLFLRSHPASSPVSLSLHFASFTVNTFWAPLLLALNTADEFPQRAERAGGGQILLPIKKTI